MPINVQRHPERDVEIRARHVIIATGENSQPKPLEWRGLSETLAQDEHFAIHSSQYRNGSAYKGQDVLVVGMGNSGAEIAIDLVY